MAQVPKPHTITWPLTPKSAEDIDQNFDALFRQVQLNAAAGLLPVVLGGTGLGSFQKGDILYAATTSTLAGLHDVVAGSVVLSGGVNDIPAYGKVALSGSVTHVTGILPVTNGGTGIALYAVGDIVTAATTTTLARVADVATGNALISGGIGVIPAWGKIGLTTHVSGILPVPNGGTSFGTYAVGDLLYADTTTTLAKLADIATGNALISGGVGVAPSYGKIGLTTHVTGVLPEGNGGTNQLTYAQGDLIYASASNTLAKLAKDTNATRYLSNTGTSNAPLWAQVALTTGVSGTLPATNGGTGFASYAVGDLLYASTTTALSKLADVATGNALISGGVNTAPSWGKIADAHISDVTEAKITDGTLLARVAANETISGTWLFNLSTTFGTGTSTRNVTVDGASAAQTGVELRNAGTLVAWWHTSSNIVVHDSDEYRIRSLAGTNYAVWVSTGLTISQSVAFANTLTPATLGSGNNNDYNPSGLSSAFLLRLTPNAAGSIITGIAGGAAGRMILIKNLNAGIVNISITQEDAASTAANRFMRSQNIAPGQILMAIYDGAATRWDIVALF